MLRRICRKLGYTDFPGILDIESYRRKTSGTVKEWAPSASRQREDSRSSPAAKVLDALPYLRPNFEHFSAGVRDQWRTEENPTEGKKAPNEG